MNKKALGKGIKEERKKLGLTQADLAQGIIDLYYILP